MNSCFFVRTSIRNFVTSFPHDLYISIFAEIVVIDKNLGNHKSGLSKIGRKVQNFKSMVC